MLSSYSHPHLVLNSSSPDITAAREVSPVTASLLAEGSAPIAAAAIEAAASTGIPSASARINGPALISRIRR